MCNPRRSCLVQLQNEYDGGAGFYETNGSKEMENKYQQITNDMDEVLRKIAEHKLLLQNLKDAKAEREFVLTPANGWEGKNETERTAKAAHVFAEDETLIALNVSIKSQEKIGVELNTSLTILEHQLRALEWSIRDQANIVLGGRSMLDVTLDDAIDREVSEETDRILNDESDAGESILSEYDESLAKYLTDEIASNDDPDAEDVPF